MKVIEKALFMTTLFQPSRDVDWFNQAISLVGGVTAQSYQSLGLLKPGQESATSALMSSDNGLFSDFFDAADVTHVESPSSGALILQADELEGASRLNMEVFEPLNSLDADAAQASGQGPFAFGSATSASELDFSGLFSELMRSEAVGQDAIGSEASLLSNSSLFDLLQQAVEQTPAQKDAFAETFSGERQSALRAEIEEGGASFREFTADVIESQTGGRVQGEVSGLLESIGIESNDSVDVYGSSQQLVSDVVDAAVQPIGAVSLPMVGPSVVAIREEFFGA